jgi:hypothetical protein
MRADGSAPTADQGTEQHGRKALTCGNSTNRRPTTQVITGQVLLLICGFGVQVPGGAPRLRTMPDLALCTCWPICATHGARPKAVKCVQEASTACTHQSIDTKTAGVKPSARRPNGTAPANRSRAVQELNTSRLPRAYGGSHQRMPATMLDVKQARSGRPSRGVSAACVEGC